MQEKWKRFVFTALSVAASYRLASAQGTPATVLEIEVENFVTYWNDVSDASKLATEPSRTTLAAQPRNFAQSISVADIVSVNGRPAKGVLTERRTQLARAINPGAGQAIADSARETIMDRYFEILKPDGTLIGSIMTSGTGGGAPPPGAPAVMLGADFTVIGGTGAFLGARGQGGGTRDSRPGPRSASMTEDPAHRRMNGGGQRRFIVHLIPLSRPEIAQTASGPAVVHSNDFSPVTSAKPAKAGEVLSLYATGLGPTVPGVDPGRPFPGSPPAAVNSPVEVMVNGQPAEVLDAVGLPGAADGFQVNFRLPPDTAAGITTVQVSVAWMAGSEVRIAVQ